MKKYLRYILSFLFGALVVLGVCSLKGVFHTADPVRALRALCDGFFLAGILLCGVGLLVFVGNNGFFDTLSYASRTVINLFMPGPFKLHPKISFAEYRMQKHEKASPYGFLVAVGSIFLLGAFICLYLFERASG